MSSESDPDSSGSGSSASSAIFTDVELEPETRQKRVFWTTKSSYGYTTGNTKVTKLKNFDRATTFRIIPVANIEDEVFPSIQFKVNFFFTESENTMTITYSELYDFAKVCCKIRQEIKGEIIDGTIRQDDFFRMQKQQIDEWCNGADYKVLQPVRYIGPQLHLLPDKIKDVKEEDLEFFFHKDEGVLDIEGKVMENPRSVYVSELLKGVPQIKYRPSGKPGWEKHFEPPYTSNLDGDIYCESVNCGANLAHLTFNGWFFRWIYKKLGMVIVAGAPKLAKTKEIRSCIHMASSSEYFFTGKTTTQFIQLIVEKVCLAVVYDDNSSKSKKEALVITKFDGGAVGTKGGGIQKMVGELIMTTNDVHARPDRLKTGRLELLMKMYPGYNEPDNVMDALEELEMLNIAHNDVDKPLDFMVSLFKYWLQEIPRPDALASEDVEKTTTQMKAWFALTVKEIKDQRYKLKLGGTSIREMLTTAALNMWPHMYDLLLPPTSKWHKNGGKTFYYRSYMPKQMLATTEVYAKPLDNPGVSTAAMFDNFVRKIVGVSQDKVDLMNEEAGEENTTNPGDFINGVRLQSWKQVLYVAFVNNINYTIEFGCPEQIKDYKDYIKSKGGILNKSVTIKGTSLKTTWIPILYFEAPLRKKIIKLLMRPNVEKDCAKYGSVRLRKRPRPEVEVSETEPGYDDSANSSNKSGSIKSYQC